MFHYDTIFTGLATGEWLQLLPKPEAAGGIVSPNSGWGGDMGNTWTGDDVEVASRYPSFCVSCRMRLRGR